MRVIIIMDLIKGNRKDLKALALKRLASNTVCAYLAKNTETRDKGEFRRASNVPLQIFLCRPLRHRPVSVLKGFPYGYWFRERRRIPQGAPRAAVC
jgi:hypothetical protein